MHFSITQKYVVDLRLYGYTYHWKYLIINRLKINLLLKNINRNANFFFFLTRVIITVPPPLCRYCPLWDSCPSRFCSSLGWAREKTSTHWREVIPYKHILMCFPRQCGISWNARPPFLGHYSNSTWNFDCSIPKART